MWRFTQQDPIGLAGGLNLYGFAGGDPVNFSDPFGLCPTCPLGAVGAAVFGGVRAISNVASGRPWHENVARDMVGGFAIGITAGLAAPALLAGSGSAATGTAVATGSAALPRIPFEGFQEWGRNAVQWGSRASGAIERAAEMTVEQAGRIDPQKVQAARDFYGRMVDLGRGGPAAVERVKLMERIIELQRSAQ